MLCPYPFAQGCHIETRYRLPGRAGPGDPGLITVKGMACLQRADVVVYDYLDNPVFLEDAPATAERI